MTIPDGKIQIFVKLLVYQNDIEYSYYSPNEEVYFLDFRKKIEYDFPVYSLSPELSSRSKDCSFRYSKIESKIHRLLIGATSLGFYQIFLGKKERC